MFYFNSVMCEIIHGTVGARLKVLGRRSIPKPKCYLSDSHHHIILARDF